jgi:hypothetical protein
MTAHELRCAAGHVVGVTTRYDGLIAVQHQGREIVAYGVVCIRCTCGATWTPDAPRLPLEGLEWKAPTLAGRR